MYDLLPMALVVRPPSKGNAASNKYGHWDEHVTVPWGGAGHMLPNVDLHFASLNSIRNPPSRVKTKSSQPWSLGWILYPQLTSCPRQAQE